MKKDKTRPGLNKKDLGPYKPICCPECNFSVPRNTTLKRHLMISHSEVKTCQFCGKTFTNVKDFRKHENSHMMAKYKKSMPCDVCGKVLASAGILKQHIEFVHGNDKDKES